VRSKVGARLNAIDNQSATNEAAIVALETNRSSIEDLDYAEAAAQLNLQLVALQAAQQSFVRIQGLSLFNYL
jgi:flagellar hook-associated protein 3 FlgL